MSDLSNWSGCEVPTSEMFEGEYVRLEKLNVAKHGDGLFVAASQEDAKQRHLYLFDAAPSSRENFQPWLEKAEASADPLFYAVIDKRTGLVCGRQTYMRMDGSNGSIEIGNIFWNADISRTPVTTEALYLFAKHVFEDLGYRRFEWKCNNDNEPSKKAALRYGFSFEGVFRQHLVAKGKNRDTAWFAMVDYEWPKLAQAFEAWLSSDNFGSDGKQKTTLVEQRKIAGAV